MLASLSIKNFALIEQLDIRFSNEFSIITGETGAGKSILLGALGLVLGRRADLTSLKDKEQKCIIEAHFEIKAYALQPFFEENDLDYEDTTIIRREILPSGKSRAFVNDSPVNLQELQQLGDFLLDIHSQHQTQELSNEEYQIQILDAIAGQQPLLQEYKSSLSTYKAVKSKLKKLQSEKEALVKEQDYNSFLLEELLAANLKEGEQQEYEAVFEKLNNVEFIKESLDKSLAVADEEQIGVTQNLKEIKASLQKIAGLSAEYQELFDRVSSVLIEFDDVSDEIRKHAETLMSDPEQLELVNQKLQLIYSLQKKHQVGTVEELLVIQNDLDNKAVFADDLEALIHSLEKELEATIVVLDAKAAAISESRKQAAPVLIEKIIAILSELGMPNARFEFEIKQTDTYLLSGKDEVQLLFSANKGTSFGLLKKVASGGEMSRIMLAVKAILANYTKLPTIIFDEIDTGVSGEIAHKMGDIMKKMSKQMQVFAITHLPQIAAKGNQHYKVFKSTQGENTVSELKLLGNEERIVEIAEMLSGKDISDSALNHAKSLLIE
ncbi:MULTISPECIES: DNA repair protein RecN [unclassified Flavobacterium]|uniref:DNA repair protein RecN n=1 Tax=unclassified Flavobacterium TaxID=196869 RepID=UPI00086E1635|nr:MULTISPECIES: DNA repair protein RecN [unclassified Flavobacterium]MBN9282970.1 DNA repair protein RecN [Flavobacterium sp.]ODS83481.1 MAG: DNA repair protein RecN [Chryseobacterium sp. SCN 40-13]OJV67604.1 MAG: DNA repair protein RecN [Flavobacterium sp. 40-81]